MSTLELTPAQIKFFASINPDSIPADTVAVEIKHDGQTVRARPIMGSDTGQVEVFPNSALSVDVPHVEDWVGGLVLRLLVSKAKVQAPKPEPKIGVDAIKAALTPTQAAFFACIDTAPFPQGLCVGQTKHKGLWVRVQCHPYTRAEVLVGTDHELKNLKSGYSLWSVPGTENVTPYNAIQAVQKAAVEAVEQRVTVGPKDLIVNTPPVERWRLDSYTDEAADLSYTGTVLRYSTRVKFKDNGIANVVSYRHQGLQRVPLFEADLPTDAEDRNLESLHSLLVRYTAEIREALKG